MRWGLGWALGWACWMTWSNKLGPEAGWAGLTGLQQWAGPEPSLRHVRQAWPPGGHAFQDKKHFLVIFENVIFDKNGPVELDADEPRKFQGPPDRILGPADMGGGGGGPGPAKFW